MKKNYHLGRREVAHRVEVKTRERWIQGYCASALEERGHIGHLVCDKKTSYTVGQNDFEGFFRSIENN